MKCPKCDSKDCYKNGQLKIRQKDNVITKQLYCNSCKKYSTIEIKDVDRELIEQNVRFKKQTQKYQDTNRIERKAFRENARIENAIEEYTSELIKQIREHAKHLNKIELPEIKITNDGYIGVLHISDWHCNELINLPNNKYDFEVLSRRMKKYVNEAIKLFSVYGINKVLIAHTGDMLNSDRRLDELLNQATNRSKATLLTVHLLKQFILDLRQFFTIDIVSVLGNESRVNKEMSFANNVISDNYDYTIFAILREMFEYSNVTHVNFGSIDKMEEVVNINSQNWLLKHDYGKSTSKQKDTQATIGRYSLNGIKIDYIIGGHIHATRMTELSTRASSMAGPNEYSENALDLAGRASQPLYIVGKDERILINIDLQHVGDVEGYHIIEKLQEYNAKSHDKCITKETILKITI